MGLRSVAGRLLSAEAAQDEAARTYGEPADGDRDQRHLLQASDPRPVRALGEGGAGLAAANPTYNNTEAEREGMVGIDFRIVDGKTGRVVTAFKSTGTFKAASASTGISLFGIGGTDTKFAQSATERRIIRLVLFVCLRASFVSLW